MIFLEVTIAHITEQVISIGIDTHLKKVISAKKAQYKRLMSDLLEDIEANPNLNTDDHAPQLLTLCFFAMGVWAFKQSHDFMMDVAGAVATRQSKRAATKKKYFVSEIAQVLANHFGRMMTENQSLQNGDETRPKADDAAQV